jgi:gas vesicle protein
MQYFIAQQTAPPTRNTQITVFTPQFFAGALSTLIILSLVAMLNHLLTKRRESTNQLETKAELGESAIMKNEIIDAILASESRIKSELRTEIKEVESRLDTKISSVESRLNDKIDSVETKLRTEIKESETRLYNQIFKLEVNMETRFTKQDQVIQRVAVLESKVN